MHVTFSPEELAFQQEVRSFFRDEFPDDIREKQDKGTELSPEDMVRWQQLLHEKGWAGVNWPVEYGGTGWAPVQKYIFATEEAIANACALCRPFNQTGNIGEDKFAALMAHNAKFGD